MSPAPRSDPRFPMPGDQLGTRTVIASCWHSETDPEDRTLCLNCGRAIRPVDGFPVALDGCWSHIGGGQACSERRSKHETLWATPQTDRATVLLLNEAAPFYLVETFDLDTWVVEWAIAYDNIVPAAEGYNEQGGCW